MLLLQGGGGQEGGILPNRGGDRRNVLGKGQSLMLWAMLWKSVTLEGCFNHVWALPLSQGNPEEGRWLQAASAPSPLPCELYALQKPIWHSANGHWTHCPLTSQMHNLWCSLNEQVSRGILFFFLMSVHPRKAWLSRKNGKRSLFACFWAEMHVCSNGVPASWACYKH